VQQTYKINIEGRALILMDEELLAESGPGSNQLALPYRGVKNTLFQYLDTLEKSNRFESILLYSNDVNTLLEDLKSLVMWIPAAGGVIENKDDSILLIFRKGYWDLPKGKLDTQETSKGAALRECEEETGLSNLFLGKKIYESWHLYREKNGQRALKKTKWFAMNYQGNQIPKPQLEEDIIEVAWIHPEQALLKEPMYENIKSVIQSFMRFKLDVEGFKL
jgi:8-oxo-dGTP pyrophosphatase MutT (NUDIX family)